MNIVRIFCFLSAVSAFAMDSGVRDISLPDIIETGKAITSQAYPDADEVLVDSVHLEFYNKDGTSHYEDDSYTKILTEKGRRGNMTASLHLSAAYETTDILHAQIIGEDGSVTDVDTNRYLSVMTETSQMSSNIYDPNQKTIRISYPNLKIGDIVRLHIRSTTFKARIPGVWSDYAVFENTSPIKKYTYCVSAPADLPAAHIRIRGELDGTMVSSTNSLPDGRILYRFEISNVPQLFPEPDMPAAYTVAQRMLFSTASSWTDISKWYWNLSKPRLESTTPEMLNTVAKLKEKALQTAGKDANAKTRNDQIVRDIFTWVSQNIRYMGVTTEKEAPGYEPHDISMTYSNRYGVCRDKAALLVGMLRHAGVDAYPVLIHVGEKRDPEVPMTFFNHAIASVRNDDGTYTLMDPTNESAHDLLPAYLDNKSFLVAHPDGEELRVSPVTPSSANMLSVKTNAEIADDGKLTLTSAISFNGLNDNVYRGAFSRMPAEQRKMFFDGVIKKRLSGATLEKLEIRPDDLQNTDEPLEISLTASVADFPATGDKATLLSIPWLSGSLGYVNFLLGNTGLEKRRFPIELETACGAEETITLYIPATFTDPICLPSTTAINTNGVSFSMKVDSTGHLLTANRHFAIEVPDIPAENYVAFKETLKDIEYANRQQAVFGPVLENSAPDQRIISENVSHEISYRHAEPPTASQVNFINATFACDTTVSVVREILTYAGKKKNSELKISYNPAWESVELIAATVSNANGTVKSVQPHEINIMDAPWVASAPRYPAGKTMVISLPGVEVGSVIATSYRVTTTNLPLAHFSHSFQNFDPTELSEISVTTRNLILRENDISLFHLDGVDYFATTNGNGHVTRTWKYANPPTIPREENLPRPHEFTSFLCGSLGSWARYRAQMAKVIQKAVSPSASVKASEKAKDLATGIPDTRGKVRAVRDYVVKNIRLAGPSFTDIPLAASDADVTLADGYGNSFDRAVLLYAMLNSLELNPSFILVDPAAEKHEKDGVRIENNPRYIHPSMSAFTVPLVSVDVPETIFLNDTDQYARLGVTSSDSRNYLSILSATGKIPASQSKARHVDGADIYHIDLPAELENHSESEKTIELDANGNAEITIRNTGYGTEAAGANKLIAEMPPEERRRFHMSLIGEISVSAEIAGPLVTDTTNYPATISYSAKVPKYAVKSGKTMTLRIGNPAPLIQLRSDKRRNPLSISEKDLASSKTLVILPESAEEVLLSPPGIDLDLSVFGIYGGFLKRTSKVFRNDAGRLCIEINASRKLNHSVLGKEIYPAILEINRRLSHPGMGCIVIKCKE